MAEYRNIRVSEAMWVRLKQRALDERCTLLEIVERAGHMYLAAVPGASAAKAVVGGPIAVAAGPRYEKDEFSQ